MVAKMANMSAVNDGSCVVAVRVIEKKKIFGLLFLGARCRL